MKLSGSYLNLRDLSDFNKFITALGGAAFIYFDRVPAYTVTRVPGVMLAASVVFIGALIIGTKSYIKGDDIEFASEPDSKRRFIFRLIAALSLAQIILVIAMIIIAAATSVTA